MLNLIQENCKHYLLKYKLNQLNNISTSSIYTINHRHHNYLINNILLVESVPQ